MQIEEAPQPTASKERVNSAVSIRGITLLGIILMNIIGLGAVYLIINCHLLEWVTLKIYATNNMDEAINIFSIK